MKESHLFRRELKDDVMFGAGITDLSVTSWEKDTVTTDEEDDKVNAHDHVWEDGSSVRHDAVIHHGVPVLSGEDLHRRTIGDY